MSRSTSAALAELAVAVHPAVRPHADEYLLADGRRLILLAEGRVVNLVAAEGNPAAVMDLSFAVQALALAWLAGRDARGGRDGQGRESQALPPGVHEVPDGIDAQIATLALASLGTEIDALTPGSEGVPRLLAPGLLGKSWARAAERRHPGLVVPAAGLNDGYSRAFQWAAGFCLAALAASFVVPAVRGQRPASGTGR